MLYYTFNLYYCSFPFPDLTILDPPSLTPHPLFLVVYGNKSLVIKNGGVQAAVTSLRTMAHNPDVVGLALKLLGNLIELGNKLLYVYCIMSKVKGQMSTMASS